MTRSSCYCECLLSFLCLVAFLRRVILRAFCMSFSKFGPEVHLSEKRRFGICFTRSIENTSTMPNISAVILPCSVAYVKTFLTRTGRASFRPKLQEQASSNLQSPPLSTLLTFQQTNDVVYTITPSRSSPRAKNLPRELFHKAVVSSHPTDFPFHSIEDKRNAHSIPFHSIPFRAGCQRTRIINILSVGLSVTRSWDFRTSEMCVRVVKSLSCMHTLQ